MGQNMKVHFMSLYLRTALDIMKRGTGSAGLCAVSNCVWPIYNMILLYPSIGVLDLLV